MSADWGEHVAAFENAMNQRGLMPVEGIQADGKLQRCRMEGDTEKNGFYALHIENGCAWGMFGHWVDHPEPIPWSSKGSKPVDPENAAKFKREIAAARQQRTIDLAESQAAAAQQARADLAKLKDTDAEHPYLIAKHIKPHGVKETPDGRLVVSVSIDEKISSLHYIAEDGEKLFLKGGKTKGGYYRLGGKPNGTIYIAEGFATGASVREATKETVFVAFACGNLKAVAEWAHKKYPNDKIVVVADNDLETLGNPGVTHAQAAAAAVGGAPVVIPIRTAEPERKCDINDLHVDEGIDAIRTLLCANQEGAIMTTLSEIVAEPVEWFWKPKIAAKKVTLLAGDPGLGKSFVALYMAAMVSAGGAWTDGGIAPAGDIVLLSLEDDPADTIRPRLDALGADCTKIHLLTGVRKLVKGKLVEHMFDLNADLPALEQTLQRYPNIKLIIIDPISAYLGRGGLSGSDSHNNSQMRALLAPLSVLATKYHLSILAISHLNKGSMQSVYRVTGSLAFIAVARATWFIIKDPTNPDRRLLLSNKINVGKDNSPGLAFGFNEDEQGRPVIAWEKEPIYQRLEDLLGAAAGPKPNSKFTEAVNFIHAALADGASHLSTEVQEAAKLEGIAKKTYQNARAAEVKAGHLTYETGALKKYYLKFTNDFKPQLKEQGK